MNPQTLAMASLALVAAASPLAAGAQSAAWEMIAAESRVYFHYQYEGTPYRGEFRNVEATFAIDPSRPGGCDFQVTIPIGDIFVDNPEVLDYLLDIELLDVDRFPTASFSAKNCNLKSLSSFVADGSLTIRDQTQPLAFPFDLDITLQDGQPRFQLSSRVTIQRLAFGVGQGYFANTASIPNDVDIEVEVLAGPARTARQETTAADAAEDAGTVAEPVAGEAAGEEVDEPADEAVAGSGTP